MLFFYIIVKGVFNFVFVIFVSVVYRWVNSGWCVNSRCVVKRKFEIGKCCLVLIFVVIGFDKDKVLLVCW